ncbi:MAG: GH3 auxin-responsive promoter family protein, partial [Bacteroidota bacterium]
MALVGSLFKRALQVGKSLQLEILKPTVQQKLVLFRLLRKAKQTEIGKYYGFSSILDSGQMQEEFSRRVPIHDYNLMHRRWWKSYDEGRSNITWPGKIKYFALSSGTSEAASKYIPVSGDMIKAMRRTSIKQMYALTLYDFPTTLFDKGVLMLGGSADLKFSGHYFYGDLSGINTSKVPIWFNPFFKPGEEIVRIRDWNEKIEQIVLQ